MHVIIFFFGNRLIYYRQQYLFYEFNGQRDSELNVCVTKCDKYSNHALSASLQNSSVNISIFEFSKDITLASNDDELDQHIH